MKLLLSSTWTEKHISILALYYLFLSQLAETRGVQLSWVLSIQSCISHQKGAYAIAILKFDFATWFEKKRFFVYMKENELIGHCFFSEKKLQKNKKNIIPFSTVDEDNSASPVLVGPNISIDRVFIKRKKISLRCDIEPSRGHGVLELEAIQSSYHKTYPIILYRVSCFSTDKATKPFRTPIGTWVRWRWSIANRMIR